MNRITQKKDSDEKNMKRRIGRTFEIPFDKMITMNKEVLCLW
ncbi:Uncharacterized protein dnm_014700 [Desulfonema magnum]|uniref:Uncharacterized protein n=1 Tax=Desulfonema magnum TaxID=45655 RepID=A0A975BGS7_9BACT|nr:Uncharacterized protein dnm_014700 [Desulfonema magnum]